LWAQYREEGFLDEIGDRKRPIMRALPERDTISSRSQVLPFEDAVKLVRQRDYIAVAYCPCRIIAKLVGQGCRHSLENCIHMGSIGKYMVEHGMARRVTPDEALKILRKSNREGLVHLMERTRKVSTICNCCNDCCVFFQTVFQAKYPHAIAHSSYVAEVDISKCIACGICALRCPMKAVRVKINKEPANVDPEKCLGCGVCVPTCPVEAIELLERDELPELPDGITFIQEMLEDRGRDPSGLF
jgi:Pyruvate/2-oxoacid:ferredoxin oxidoreductase delta subunit